MNAVALVVGLACVAAGLAGLLGGALRARLQRVTRDHVVDVGDWSPEDSRDMDDAVAGVTDPLTEFCCADFPDCVHDAHVRAELGDPDPMWTQAALHAATPESFRRWLDAHGLEV